MYEGGLVYENLWEYVVRHKEESLKGNVVNVFERNQFSSRTIY